jgi:NADP-dependent 3-hydroxy acid dehydrogenase YdfG
MDDYDAYAVNTTINAAATGTFLLTRKLVPSLEASGAGDIVNIVSTSGIANRPNSGAAVPLTGWQSTLRPAWPMACAKNSKAGPCGFTPSTRRTLKPSRHLMMRRGMRHALGDMVTSRDVVEAALFALTRPRNVTVASIVLDSDSDHTWG